MATGLSKLLIAAPTLVIFSAIGAGSAAAQVTLDGTANPNFTGRAPFDGSNYDLRAELGRRAGFNLFHSFEKFSLRTGERATFSGPDQIRNIISRVTGGARSDVDGTIASTIPGADFYFLNPAGVVFGPNASLDLQGSFHVSTADELRFSDGAKFSVADPSASSFTVAAPEAFGFLSGDRGTLSVADSRLRVRPGEAISLVGGEVTIAGGSADEDNPTIEAGRGTITVGAVGVGGGQFTIRSGRLEAPDRDAIRVTDGAFMDTSGNGAGLIRIRGGRVVIRAGSFIFSDNDGNLDAPARNGVNVDAHALRLRANSLLTADVVGGGTGRGGAVSVRADKVEITDGSRLAADTFADGNAGSVRVTAGELEILNGGAIRSNTAGPGNAGAVAVDAERLRIDGRGSPTGITSETQVFVGEVVIGSGDAGAVSVTAGDLEIRNAGTISSTTFGPGDAGTVAVEATRLLIDHDGSPFLTGVASDAGAFVTDDGRLLAVGQGDAGVVRVAAGELEILNGGAIRSNTVGPGDAGAVAVVADRLLIDGRGSPTGITSETQVIPTSDGQVVVSEGKSGSVRVTAGDLEMRNAGTISSTTFGPGDAGSVTVEAARLLISDEGSPFATGVASDAGAFVTDDGRLLAVGQGNAGSVSVTAGEIEILTSGVIRTNTFGRGDAGEVTVDAERLLIDGQGFEGGVMSEASFVANEGQVLVAEGNAGSVSVTTGELEIRNGGVINSSSFGFGRPGNVRLDVGSLILETGGAIGSVSSLSPSPDDLEGGTIDVTARSDITISGQAGSQSGILSTTVGPRNAGSIRINAPLLRMPQHALIDSSTTAAGDAGAVVVAVDRLTMGPGSFISSTSPNFREPDFSGGGGRVRVVANELIEIVGGGVTTSTATAGPAGSVEIEARTLRVLDGGEISSASFGMGNAGNISVEVTDRLEMENGAITTEAQQSAGGGITLMVGELILLADGSQVTSSIFGDVQGDRAGNITIDPRFLILDQSDIIARANAGDGGSITIEADNLVRSAGSAVDASSMTGISGTVAASTPEADLSGGLVALEGALLDAASQLRERCGARRDIGASSFTGVGRGGLPASPDAPLAGAYLPAAPSGVGGLEGRAAVAASFNRPALVAAPCLGAP